MSRITPYVPMKQTPLAGDAEVARMMEKLAKRAAANASVAVTEPPPASKPEPTIAWQEVVKHGPGAWSTTSVDGRFYIHKVKTRESVTYTCWKKGSGLLGLNEKLGERETREEAIALCEAAQ